MKKIVDDIFGTCYSISVQEGRRISMKFKETLEFPKLVKGESNSLQNVLTKRSIYSQKSEICQIEDLLEPVNKQKKFLPMFSFNIDGKTSAVVLDIENHKSGLKEHENKGNTLLQVINSLKDFEYIAYYSASSTSEAERFRVVIPLSEPVDSEIFDYCRTRLYEAFNKIPDVHSFESARWFFVPSKYVGFHREPNEVFTNKGCSLDFYATTGFNEADRKQMQTDKQKRDSQKSDVIDDERVDYYLNTDFPMMTGNGDSDSSLYKAVVTCLAHDDEDTLDEVLDKARSEGWSEKELDEKVKKALKFLEEK